MSQRVGDRYLAKKSSVNIYSDDPCKGDSNDDMCLNELAKQRRTPSPDNVKKIRLKIGLGVTLSKENGSIWLYNRSMLPIFVNSPTLSENWHCVCKILPGYCLKAFDSERAQTLKYPSHFPGAQLGPKDPYGMQISFGKGWGDKYKRQDVTNCPCWFEVLLPTQR
ncbi:mothers against decapentaplegic homolog 6-like [Teleopsis dalmanni]|uniref:mothers against decapentaplegic homolog 6-like n=2 Tax=Teleopsis dalmanni TaxID=139649 RepID=UPI0018CE4653|nr:mothers against decapentaplegic homolog 6-like [Teleopsis dalmanni]